MAVGELTNPVTDGGDTPKRAAADAGVPASAYEPVLDASAAARAAGNGDAPRDGGAATDRGATPPHERLPASAHEVERRTQRLAGEGESLLPPHLERLFLYNSAPTPAGRVYYAAGDEASVERAREVEPVRGEYVFDSDGDENGPDIGVYGLTSDDTAALILVDNGYHDGDAVVLTFPAGGYFRDRVATLVGAPVSAPDRDGPALNTSTPPDWARSGTS